MKTLISLVVVLVLIITGCLAISGCSTTSPAPASSPAAPAPSQVAPASTQAAPSAPPVPQTQSAASAAAAPLTLDIGVASPVTGPTASLGIQMRNGALMAIEDTNAKGGVTIGGQKYRLNPITMDTKADPKEGKAVADQLVFDKKVKIIIGPSIEDAIAIQQVTEANKVIGIFLQPIMPEMSTASKPYTFFTPGPLQQFYDITVNYIAKNYPKSKTMVSVMPDLVDSPTFSGPAKKMCDLYGLTWVRAELFPIQTKDFAPLISKITAGNPDIIDTASTGGKLGGLCAVLIKQIREAGYKGLIMVPASPPESAMKGVIPEQYRTGIVINDINPESKIVPSSYPDLRRRLTEKFPKEPPENITMKIYNVSMGFFQFLNGQSSMDTTAWMQGFAEYRWKNPWGQESFFCGKPIWGINRMCFGSTWVSEYINGAYETKAEMPINMDMYYTK
jgi:branched-chain amino acid transport system substrate-binding protein